MDNKPIFSLCPNEVHLSLVRAQEISVDKELRH